MEVIKETSPGRDLKYGHVSVGLSAVQLCNAFTTRRGVVLQTDKGNTASVYIGGPNVQANTGPAGGLPLPPGTSIHIPIDDPSTLFVISTDSDQDIAWMGV